MTCYECELNKARAALWRHEAYKQGGTPLPWDVDEAIAKAVAAEREAIWNIVFDYAGRDDISDVEQSLLKHLADAIRRRT